MTTERWWSLVAANTETQDGWGTEGDAKEWCRRANRGREINRYAVVETPVGRIAELERYPDRGINLADNLPPLEDQILIRVAIEESGLSSRQFAERVMGREGRTIRRWMLGEIAIPTQARAWLERWLALSDATRERIVGALR